MKRKLIFILIAGLSSIVFWQVLESRIYAQNKEGLTLVQIKNSLNVSNDKAKESSITAKKVRQVGVTFPLTLEIECDLRYAGATNELIEAVRQNSPSLPTPATTDLSNETVITDLESSWNFYAREEILLGPNYFGNTVSNARFGDSNYALALMSDYPTYRALATKGLIKLDEFSLSAAPPTGLRSSTRIERAATVTLTQAGAKLGTVDNKANTVTFVLGTYRVEKIESNTVVDTNYGNYRLVQGTHVFDVREDFRAVWSQSGKSTYRERRFRVIFKYDPTDDLYKLLGKSWRVATASNCRFTAMDIGPRNGDFETANVPPTLDQLRRKPKPSLSQTKQSRQIAEIIVEKANLRESPNASSEIIREVAFGERFFLSDIQPVGAWYKVVEVWTGKEGWLHGNTFKIVTVDKSNNPKTFENSIETVTAAANKSWTKFFAEFRAAVTKRDRVALRKMISSKFDWTAGELGISPDDVLKNLDIDGQWRKGKPDMWKLLQKSLVLNRFRANEYDSRPARDSIREPYVLFVFETDGRWRWAAFLGD